MTWLFHTRTMINRARQVRIHGTKYTAGAIVRVKTPSQLPYAYCQIQDIYIYNDHKVFKLGVMKIIQYVEHLRAIEIGFTSQTLLAVYDDFYGHGVLHLKESRLMLLKESFGLFINNSYINDKTSTMTFHVILLCSIAVSSCCHCCN